MCERTAGSEKGTVVLALEFADFLFDGFQVNCHFVEGLEAFFLRVRILEVGEGGVDLHELESDGFGSVADLLDGFGACHGGGLRPGKDRWARKSPAF